METPLSVGGVNATLKPPLIGVALRSVGASGGNCSIVYLGPELKVILEKYCVLPDQSVIFVAYNFTLLVGSAQKIYNAVASKLRLNGPLNITVFKDSLLVTAP